MRDSRDIRTRDRGRAAWGKFVAGTLLLAGVVLTLMQGYAPPGPAGEVLRNNLRRGIDATPLFYTEVESLAPEDRSSRNPHRSSGSVRPARTTLMEQWRNAE